jgi:hypothetical protein
LLLMDWAKIRFEFTLATTNPFGEVTYFERQSGEFGKFYEDSANNLSIYISDRANERKHCRKSFTKRNFVGDSSE